MARNDAKKSLKPNQRTAITALLTEPTLTAAAESAGVSRNTLARWLRDDETFIGELRDAERAIDDETLRRLVALQTKALDAIGDVFTSISASHSERLRAAELVLAQRARLRELHDIDERLTALEAMTNG